MLFSWHGVDCPSSCDRWQPQYDSTNHETNPSGTIIVNDLPILDKSAALESTGGDESLAQILLDTCLEDSPKLIEEARDAVANGDFVSARRSGHSLKSSFGVVGAAVAAAESEKLEFIESDDLDAFKEAIAAVDAAFRAVVAASDQNG
jgi:HPt (histidine-containing phosphotransfer) domain-containing protein